MMLQDVAEMLQKVSQKGTKRVSKVSKRVPKVSIMARTVNNSKTVNNQAILPICLAQLRQVYHVRVVPGSHGIRVYGRPLHTSIPWRRHFSRKHDICADQRDGLLISWDRCTSTGSWVVWGTQSRLVSTPSRLVSVVPLKQAWIW